MIFRIVLGDWPTQRTHAEEVRREVFIFEQHVPVELEWDEMDAVSLHAVAIDDAGQAIGTARLLPDGHIGRMAVKCPYRKTGVGATLLATMIEEAKQRGHKAAMLNAQIQVEPFYARFGFVREGDEFMDAGIPHIHMCLQL
jgi:predicted GNAT family N-acyltransferase